jgi:uncharacterized membrane protein YheB (UPF0754 family)
MGNKKAKTFLLLFLLAVFLLQAGTVFALEIKWPPVPGAETPNEIQHKVETGVVSKESSLPLYINYFLRFFYALAIAVAVIVIIYGGVLYLVSGAKPALKSEARDRITQALLGLFILLASYLFLAIINPQLLVFKIERPLPVKITVPPQETKLEEAAFLQVPLGTLIDKVLNDLDETTTTKKWGTVRKVEVPFLTVSETLEGVVTTTDWLIKEFKDCRCGRSKFHTVEKSILWKECAPGISDKEGKAKFGKDWDNIKQGKGNKQDVCLSVCDDCGTANIDSIEFQGNDNPDCNIAGLKEKRRHLQRLLAKLEVQKTSLSAEEIELVVKVLGGEAGKFLMSESEDAKFQEDFKENLKQLKEYFPDVEIKIERPKQFPEPKTVTMSPPQPDPFTLYIPLKGKVFSPQTTSHNQDIYRQSQRASIFSVLTRLSLEDIEGMLQQCLQSAFGQGNFLLDRDMLKSIVEKAAQEGIGNFLVDFVENNSDKFTETFFNNLNKQIEDKFKEKLNQNCANLNVQNCSKQNIPPHFLSNLLLKVMTQPIKQRLPEEIQRDLTQKIRERIFDQKLNTYLTSSLADLLDKALGGALSKSLDQQIGLLRENLDKKMTDFLPELILDPLQTVDSFLIKNVKHLKERINREIAAVISKLAQSLVQAATDIISGYKSRHTAYFREYSSPEECWGYWVNGEGWYFDIAGWPQYKYNCKKVTPKQINFYGRFLKGEIPCAASNLCKSIMTPGTQDPQTGVTPGCVDYYPLSQCVFSSSGDAETDIWRLCRAQGFCWYEEQQPDGTFAYKCQECSSLNLSGLKPTKENMKKMLRAFVAGLVNFAEQFLVALTQTASYTLTKYAQVWVEDEIIGPLQPYLDQLGSFQQKLHKFLTSTIRELLPQQLSTYLASNIEQVISQMCNDNSLDPQVRDAACNIDDELRKNILQELSESGDLGKDIVTILEGSVLDAICKVQGQQRVCDFLDKSPAELIWPGITGINDLITGTPKQLICGEIVPAFKNGVPDFNQTSKVKDVCDSFKTNFGGINLPVIDHQGSAFQSLSSTDKKIYGSVCPAIWLLCEPPINTLSFNIGSFAKEALEQKCNDIYSSCSTAEDCSTCGSESARTSCQGCNVMIKQSLAFTLFKWLVEHNYGLTVPPPQANQEIKSYQWMAVTFPKAVGEIDKLSEKRGLRSQWYGTARSDALNHPNDSVFAKNLESNIQAFVSWFTQNLNLEQALTSIPFGVMGYFHPKEKEGREYVYGPERNFLAKTPYQFLHNEICGRVIWEFARDYPDSTIERILSGEYAKKAGSLPYSIENLHNPSIGEAIQLLFETPGIDSLRKERYLFCKALDYSPAEILGIDQKLIQYIRPRSYQVLFALMKDKLKPEERPDALNKLLDYLYNYTPGSMLRMIGDKLILEGNIDTGNNIKQTGVFLEKKIGDIVRENWLDANTKMVVLLFRALGLNEQLLSQRLGWDTWNKLQKLLMKTPIDIIKDNLLNKNFTELLPQNIKNILQKSIMERISENNFLSERYVDTLGKALHLTEPINHFYLNTVELSQKVNAAASSTRAKIQDSFNKLFLEYPRAGLSFIGKNLAKLVGLKLGEKTADQVAGSCRAATNVEKLHKKCEDPNRPNEVYKIDSNECCDLGLALVCQPSCRIKPQDKDCDSSIGELEKNVNGQTMCCLATTDDGGVSCNPAASSGKGLICRTPPKTDNSSPTECKRKGEKVCTVGTNELCCREVEKQTLNGQTQFCTNVTQCLVDKITFHLELLSDILVNGPPLNQLIKKPKETLPPPEAKICPKDQSKLCLLPKELAKCNDTPFPPKRAPELDDFLKCVEQQTGVPLPQEGDSNPYYGSLFTYEHNNPLCNYSRGRRVCGKCEHTVYSCHYGGETGKDGALAVDFGNEKNQRVIDAAVACLGLTKQMCTNSDGTTYQCFLDNNGRNRILLEEDHIHISMPSCSGT